jgi:transposase
VRSRLVGQRTALINQIRGFLLERGIAVRQGLRFLRQQLPEILAKRIDVLSPRMIRIVEDLSGDWRRLDERNKLARIAWTVLAQRRNYETRVIAEAA